MRDASMLQLVVGTMGVMVLVITATFAGYWKLFGKKHSLVKKEIPRSVNAGVPLAGTGNQK